MRRTAAGLAAALAAAVAAAGPPAAAAPDPVETAIVHLAGPRAPLPRAARGAAVERALRDDLGRRSAALRPFLAAERAAGRLARVRDLWIVGGIAVTARRSELARLARRPGVASVEVDRRRYALAGAPEPNIALVGAPTVWAGMPAQPAGDRGEGVVVATLDTGVDLSGELGARFRGGPGSWFDAFGRHATPTDRAGAETGHGTATMGVIVGGDATGTAVGVAPAARFIAAKIFDDDGSSSTAAIHAAFQWALDPDGNPDTADAPAVVSSSWNELTTDCDREFEPDLVALRAAGVLPVFAAGNAPLAGGLAPANLPEAFAVGAVDDADAIWQADAAHGSALGPSSCGGQFPALVAPGVQVTTDALGGGTGTWTGTSLAAPHVAGALALLLSTHPGMTADEQAAALEASAHPLGGAHPDPAYGFGRLDVAAALAGPLPAPRDAVAPILLGGAASPAFTRGAVPVVVTATATDAVPGARLASGVAGGDWRVDGAAASPLAALDGTFGATAEGVRATVPAGTLAEGRHVVGLRVRDGAGNVSRLVDVPVVVDRHGPAVDALARAEADGTVTLSLGATDALSPVAGAEWFAGADPGAGRGHALAAADGRFDSGDEAADAVLRGLLPGPQVVRVRARDAAGNWSAPLAVAATVRWVAGPRVLADGFEGRALGGAWRRGGAARVARAARLHGRGGLLLGAHAFALHRLAATPRLAAGVLVDLRGAGRGAFDLVELQGAGGRVAAALRVSRAGGVVRVALCAGGRCAAGVAVAPRRVRVEIYLRGGAAALRVDGRVRATLRASIPQLLALRLGGPAAGSVRADDVVATRPPV